MTDELEACCLSKFYLQLFFVIINFSEYLALKQHVDQLRHKQMKLRNQRDVSISFLVFVIIHNLVLSVNISFLSAELVIRVNRFVLTKG